MEDAGAWVRARTRAREDPTFGRLTVPQAWPEQWKRTKVIRRGHYLLAREHLAPHWRDGMDVQADTGWHVSELVRFARMARKRLLERNSFSFEKYGLAIKAACKSAGIPPFTPGRLQHSVATWAIEKGADPVSVAAFLNHKSPAKSGHITRHELPRS